MNKRSKRVVVILSGGMDSTVLLHHHIFTRRDVVRALTFNYGQRHVREVAYAEKTAVALNIPHSTVDLRCLSSILRGSSQIDPSVAVPEGRYDEESMKATVVPNRNMIMLSIAVGHAISFDCNYVSYAAHSGDHAIYPDCRPAFTSAMERAIRRCDWKVVKLFRPFIKLTKVDIVRKGWALKVNLKATYSCYAGGEVHCGKCGTCVERRQAFHLAGIDDPTDYGPTAPGIEEMIENDWHLPSLNVLKIRTTGNVGIGE